LYDTLFGSASGTANAAAAFIWENGSERLKEYRTKTIIGSVGAIITDFFIGFFFFLILSCIPIFLYQVYFSH